MTAIDELIELMRSFESDHLPDGWPAVRMQQITMLLDEIEALRQERGGLLKRVAHLEKLKSAAIRVVGEHSAPNDCYATGPLTGDPFADFFECPSCTFLKLTSKVDAAMAKEQDDES